jgi:putative protease
MLTLNTELMAPVGSFESLQAAIQGGANSIYFGIEQLNMRARSSNNFTFDDLRLITKICRESGLKSYLTLNTIIYDHDITLMKSVIDAALNEGVNAIIASDQAVFHYAQKRGMKIHISTQANVSNIDSIEFFAQYADVVVLARELSLQQIELILKEIKRRNITGPSGQLMKVEIFAHGALCMAVSGKCYMSLHSNFSSANRGACIQNCRKSYIVTDKEDGVEFEIDNEYIMSAKDLCTIYFLDKIIKTGVSVLKIEGRGRSAEYVNTVTKCYREAIDSIHQGNYTTQRISEWKKRLSTVFNRGFWEGYYLGRTMGEWADSAGSKSTKRKVYIGRGLKYFENVGVGEFKLEAQSLCIGDEILVTGPTTGVLQGRVAQLRINDRMVEKVGKGEVFNTPVNEKIRPSDKLYKLISST